MRKPSALSTAISGILFGASAIPAGVALAQDGDDVEQIEEIVTTGSRIIRTDKFDTAGHVVAIDEVAIDALAELNIADVLRSSPLNAFGSFSERSGSSAASNATFNLRGLGSERTLVMMDGRRLPGSPAGLPDIVNINMLPMVAIQRVDILADGASAVYGSDAIAGVVNLVTHKSFDGIEMSFRYGDRERDDGGDSSIGILAGASNDKANVVVAFEYSKRDPVFDADRWFTSPFINDPAGGGLSNAYFDTDGISYYGRSWTVYDDKGTADVTDDYYEWRAAAECPTTDGFVGVLGAAALGGNSDGADGTLCGFAYAGVSANRAELEKVNSYLYASYDVSEDVEMYVRGLFSKNDSFGRYAPPAAAWPSPPIDHAHNPYDIAQMISDGVLTDNYTIDATYRWTNIGPRDNYITDTQWDISAGFTGSLTDNVAFDFYVQSGQYDSFDVGNYYLNFVGLEYVLANGLDPFSDAGLGAMKAQTTQDNSSSQDKIYGHIQFGTGDLFGNGESIALIGAEYVEIGYQNLYDPQSEAGNIGGSAGNSSLGGRDFTSLFAEWLVPLTENSELNIAARYDDYSDFGDAVSPTISYNINVTDSLALRARWGQGFKAPSLAILLGPDVFSAETATDPVTGLTRQFNTYFITNENTGAEESESYSIGANWEFIEGHSIDLAYYAVTVDDVIGQPTAQEMLFADAAGVVFDPMGSRVIRTGGPQGNVDSIYSFAANGGKLEVSGIDLQWASSFDTRAGYLDLGLFWSHQLEYKQNAYFNGGFQDTAGYHLQPQNRAQASAIWSMGDFAVDLIVNYMGEHSEEDFVDDSGVLTTSAVKLDSWTTMNLALRYDAGEWGRLKLGANNLTDEDPVLDKEGKYADEFPNMYDSLGRVIFVEYRKTFE
jgi:iron complex outermembrane receptor protein